MSDLQRLCDDKYNVVSARIVKGIRNGRYTELIVMVGDVEVKRFWHNLKEKPNEKKKGTAGRPSYVKLYLNKLDELKDKNISPELIGYLVWLIGNIEWKTGLLYKGRGKNKKNVGFDDMMKIWGIKKSKAYDIIKQLKNNSLLKCENESYFIASEFIKKGGK